ncbi:MAG: HAD-IC family P-type ATPase, partial [Candidatus Omnitrophica bacterium]|nr:HAD-IC family P-type ATPase [Candidatus Omnitrophota bacterium]
MENLKTEERGTKLKNEWHHSVEEVCRHLKSSISEGLSEVEAKKRLQETGFNELPEKRSAPAWKIFLKQFNSFIVWILFAAALISGLLAEWIDVIAIGAIIFLNAILGFVQEYHAEKSIAALRKLSTPTSKIVRDGRLQVIRSKEIVPGDLLLLEQGDRVPVDGRVIKSYLLQTQEAALTGESMPVRKHTESLHAKQVSLGDRDNMVFMGTSVAYGKGYALATATGLKTELGSIASLLEANIQEKTPLEQKLEELGNRLVFLFLGVVTFVFVLGIFRGHHFLDMFMVSLSLAVAAIPEGLPAVVTIALAFGVKKMAKRNALIRRLASVETLGCATVICTDKTGTLTKNEMTVRDLWVNQTLIKVTGSGYEPSGDFIALEKNIDPKEHDALMLALKIGSLCNGAKLSQIDGAWQIAGDPTEGALLVLAEKADCKKECLEQENPLLEELPFDSERKRMSVLRKTPEGTMLFVKGAPDIILELSDKVWVYGKEM